jgi:DNA helicase-2/ATP-dependent DNA helicase PcrA
VTDLVIPLNFRVTGLSAPNPDPTRRYAMKICEERQKLLDCTGHALVLGGPGSGKTTIALIKAALRIKVGLLPGQSVLFLSFSRAAVARVDQAAKLQVKKAERTLLNVQTFHSLFWELLKTHGYLLGSPRRLQILMPHDEKVLNGGIKEDEDCEEWNKWCLERERLFATEGKIPFDLFAPKAAELLERSAWIRILVAERFPLIIVDEAQDTSASAWRCVELLAASTQVICLADLEQQIFDHLPGIGPERIDAIKTTLAPLEINLGAENLRSPDSEIAQFGRDLMSVRVSPTGYKGVSNLAFDRKGDLGSVLRKSIGCLQRQVRKETKKWGKTVAILVPTSYDAVKVSQSLTNGTKPVRHKLLFDETEAMLAARFAAYLLEPRQGMTEASQVAEALALLTNIKIASGSNTDANRLRGFEAKSRAGGFSRAGLVNDLRALLAALSAPSFTGDPARDWTLVKKHLRGSNDDLLASVAGHLDYLVAFNRGKRISANLVARWGLTQSYTRARESVDLALTQDLIVDGADDPDGVQVMTIHKSKGKQFDGVILLRRERHDGKSLVSNILWRGDLPPYPRSRKILMVGVTRARVHTMVVQSGWPTCPILGPHRLRSIFSL